MTDESDNQTAHYVAETGEGSLLATTVGMVEERNRSDIRIIDDIAHGLEPGRLELSPIGGLAVIEPARFDVYRDQPLYRQGTAKLGDLASVIAFTNTYKTGESVIFADDNRENPGIVSIIDYHAAGEGGQRFGRFGAEHRLPLSDEWKAWGELDGESISMPNFARFLEDHIVDVVPPGMITLSEEQERFVDALGGHSRIADPAKLMELATGLRVYEDSEVGQAVNLQSGEGYSTLQVRHTDGQGGELRIPSMFVIAVPVFRNDVRYQIIVRLRYRKTAQGLVFIYELWREDIVFDHAFNEAAKKVAEDTGLPLYRGTRGNT